MSKPTSKSRQKAAKPDTEGQTQTSTLMGDADHSPVEVPSVTKLLNRKSFEQARPQRRASSGPPPYVPDAPTENTGISIVLDVSDAELELRSPGSGGGDEAEAPVRRAGRRSQAPSSPLKIWKESTLSAGSDPLGHGLAKLLRGGASQVLFLAITAPPPDSPVPHFSAAACVHPGERQRLWTGLKWDPTVVPELWNLFIKAGFVELPPPGAHTNVSSSRNVVRGAFGAAKNEWVTLVRAGSKDACRGVVVLFSPHSLLALVGQVAAQLSSDGVAKAA